MQGIIFNLLADCVSERWGDEAWTDLVRGAPGVEYPVFVGPKNYPDEALLHMVGRLVQERRIALPDLLRTFGRWAFPRLAERHRTFVQGKKSAKEFLRTVEGVIHTEIRKLYEDAYLPTITYEEPDRGTLVLIYTSRRRLCWLAEGLILGAGDFFGERASVIQEACMHEGAPACRLRTTFDGAR